MRTRKRRKQEAETDNSHRWLISYADFITLLFAFFVVMYAISSVDKAKYETMSVGLQSAFNTHNTGRPSNVLREHDKSGDFDATDNQMFNNMDAALAGLRDSDYTITRHDGWIEVDVKAGALFDSASADLQPKSMDKLKKLAAAIKGLPYPVALEGYTDNVPIHTSRFPSNWELSAGRAAVVARILNENGVENNRITVTGYGDQHPISDNNTEEGRAKNRRVNIVIARNRNVPRLLNPELGRDEEDVSEKSASKIPAIPLEKEE